MIGTQLVANFVHYIIHIKIVALWNTVCRRSESFSFLSIGANTSDTTCITSTT